MYSILTFSLKINNEFPWSSLLIKFRFIKLTFLLRFKILPASIVFYINSNKNILKWLKELT